MYKMSFMKDFQEPGSRSLKFSCQICLLFSIVVGSNVVHASGIQGPGAMSCAEFGKAYQSDPSIENNFFNWAQGFMTAMNLAVMAKQKPARELAGNVDSHKRSLREYCANNPLNNYVDGVIDYYTKLKFIPKIVD